MVPGGGLATGNAGDPGQLDIGAGTRVMSESDLGKGISFRIVVEFAALAVALIALVLSYINQPYIEVPCGELIDCMLRANYLLHLGLFTAWGAGFLIWTVFSGFRLVGLRRGVASE